MVVWGAKGGYFGGYIYIAAIKGYVQRIFRLFLSHPTGLSIQNWSTLAGRLGRDLAYNAPNYSDETLPKKIIKIRRACEASKAPSA